MPARETLQLPLGSMLSAFAFRRRALRVTQRTLITCSFFAMAASVAAWPLAHDLPVVLAGALHAAAGTGATLAAFGVLLAGAGLIVLCAGETRNGP